MDQFAIMPNFAWSANCSPVRCSGGTAAIRRLAARGEEAGQREGRMTAATAVRTGSQAANQRRLWKA